MAEKKKKEEVNHQGSSFAENRKQKEQEFVSKLKKSFGQNAFQIAASAKYKEVPRISSGLFELDLALGGGWPKGRVSLIAGNYSSGKTRLATEAVKEAQRRSIFTNKVIDDKTPAEMKVPHRVAYIDAEGTFDVSWAKHNGVDIDNLMLARPSSQEEAGEMLIGAVNSGSFDLIILDSLAQLMPQDDVDAAMDEGGYGTIAAKNNNKMFRKLQAYLNKFQLSEESDVVLPSVIILNQVREKIGITFGAPKSIYPGGVGQSFFSSVIVELKASKTEYADQKSKTDPTIGNFHFFVEKNKVSVAKQGGSFQMALVDLPEDGFCRGEFIEIKQVWDRFMSSDLYKRDATSYSFKGKKYSTQKEIYNEYFLNKQNIVEIKQDLIDYLIKK
jgi:recombination protein RecA